MPDVEAKVEMYFFANHRTRENVQEVHWKRKRTAPCTCFKQLITYKIGGMHFSADGWIYPQTLAKNYTPQKHKPRRIYSYDIIVLWAIAACPKKTLANIESMLAGRVHRQPDGSCVVPVFSRPDVMDAIRRLENLGVVSGILPKKG